jgi:hypothetical protein
MKPYHFSASKEAYKVSFLPLTLLLWGRVGGTALYPPYERQIFLCTTLAVLVVISACCRLVIDICAPRKHGIWVTLLPRDNGLRRETVLIDPPVPHDSLAPFSVYHATHFLQFFSKNLPYESVHRACDNVVTHIRASPRRLTTMSSPRSQISFYTHLPKMLAHH